MLIPSSDRLCSHPQATANQRERGESSERGAEKKRGKQRRLIESARSTSHCDLCARHAEYIWAHADVQRTHACTIGEGMLFVTTSEKHTCLDEQVRVMILPLHVQSLFHRPFAVKRLFFRELLLNEQAVQVHLRGIVLRQS